MFFADKMINCDHNLELCAGDLAIPTGTFRELLEILRIPTEKPPLPEQGWAQRKAV